MNSTNWGLIVKYTKLYFTYFTFGMTGIIILFVFFGVQYLNELPDIHHIIETTKKVILLVLMTSGFRLLLGGLILMDSLYIAKILIAFKNKIEITHKDNFEDID
jgi:hypothetical protein